MTKFFLGLTILCVLICPVWSGAYSRSVDSSEIATKSFSELSFAAIYAKVLQPRCLSCHNKDDAYGDVVIETYAEVKTLSDKIEKAALINRTMPKRVPLTDDEFSLLRSWFDAGLPEFSIPPVEPTPVPTPTPVPPLLPTYSSIRAGIFEKKCLVCHSVGAPAEKVALTGYRELLTSPRDLVLPGDSDESGLVIAVEREDGKVMPPPSSGIVRLSPEETSAIRKWIVDGALDN